MWGNIADERKKLVKFYGGNLVIFKNNEINFLTLVI